MASETILKQKEEEVKALAEKFKEAKLVLLTDYRGINVSDDTKLRTEVRNANAEYKIIKNNIVKRALNANGENGLDSLLEGPTAVVITSASLIALITAAGSNWLFNAFTLVIVTSLLFSSASTIL